MRLPQPSPQQSLPRKKSQRSSCQLPHPRRLPALREAQVRLPRPLTFHFVVGVDPDPGWAVSSLANGSCFAHTYNFGFRASGTSSAAAGLEIDFPVRVSKNPDVEARSNPPLTAPACR